MKPYKLKHVPTGLYYQPHKHRGSNLSKRGKIYQTNTHGLSSAFNNGYSVFRVFVEKDSTIHKLTKDVFAWVECSYSGNQLRADTLTKDWVKEEI